MRPPGKPKFWLTAAGCLVLIWAGAFAAVWLVRQTEPTAEDVQRLLARQSVADLAGNARQDLINRLADRINRLSFEERQRLRRSEELNLFFLSLTEAERHAFMDATLPRGMRQLMQALNDMPAQERQRLVDRALRDLRETGPDETPVNVDDEETRRLVSHGLEAYFEEASPETKLQIAPLIEQLQRRLQRTH